MGSRVSVWVHVLQFVVVLILAGVLPIGCGATAGDPLGETSAEAVGAIAITGTIVDTSGNPLPGVTVTLSGAASATATTAPNGGFAFRSLAAGSYGVRAGKTGCSFTPPTVSFSNLTSSTTANFGGSGASCGGPASNLGGILGLRTISGVITDSAGQPVPGARVAILGLLPAIRYTNAAGEYSLHTFVGLHLVRPAGTCNFTPRSALTPILVRNVTLNFVRTSCPGGDGGDAGAGGGDALPDVRDAALDVPADLAVSEAAADATRDTGAPDAGADAGDAGTPRDEACLTGTVACLRSKDSTPGACYQCAADVGCFDPVFGGHLCEDLNGVPGPASCASVPTVLTPPNEGQICLATLSNIFATRCAAGNQTNPCLCGTTAPDQCLAGTATPTGPTYPLYQCDLGPSIGAINDSFVSASRGAGVANAIVQCAQAFSCKCAF